jgi:hypothetical protein
MSHTNPPSSGNRDFNNNKDSFNFCQYHFDIPNNYLVIIEINLCASDQTLISKGESEPIHCPQVQNHALQEA